MAVLSPEGEIFSIAAGRYSGAPNFAVLKKGHAGEEMRVDRTSRDSEQVEAATVTLGICTQPGVLAELGATPQFRDQGLLGRLLFSVPDSLLGHRNHRPDPMPADQEATYQSTVKTLVLSLAGLAEPATLTFTPDAHEAISELLAETEPRFRAEGDLAHMTDWGGKLVGAAVRIAGLLHLAKHLRDGWSQPISADTFADARDLGEYFTAHAKAAYDAIGADPATADAKAFWTGPETPPRPASPPATPNRRSARDSRRSPTWTPRCASWRPTAGSAVSRHRPGEAAADRRRPCSRSTPPPWRSPDDLTAVLRPRRT